MGHTYHTAQVIEETNASGTMQRDYIFFAGRRIAWRDSSGKVYYDFADAIGSTRAVTNATGSVCFSADYYPYGQENDYNTSCSPTYKFTGYEYDSETGNYYAFARYYNPRLGRFMSPDPLGGSVADPQSLNRYTYVLNDPGSLTDPFGMDAGGGLCTPAPSPQQGYFPGDSIQCPDWEKVIGGTFSTDFSAAYGGPPPSAISFIISPNQFINGYSGATYGPVNESFTIPGPAFTSCAPSGASLKNSCNAGDQFGKDLKAAEGAYVKYVNGVTKTLWPILKGTHGLSFPGAPGTPSLSLPTVLKPTCSVPGVMGQFVQTLKDWLKNNPDAPLPPWLLMPPAWVVSCAAA